MCERRREAEKEGRGGEERAGAASFFDCCIVVVALYEGVGIFSPLSALVLVKRTKAVKNTLAFLTGGMKLLYRSGSGGGENERRWGASQWSCYVAGRARAPLALVSHFTKYRVMQRGAERRHSGGRERRATRQIGIGQTSQHPI